MADKGQNRTVIEGEASESDDEVLVDTPAQVIVSGEASESEEEEEAQSPGHIPLIVDRAISAGDPGTVTPTPQTPPSQIIKLRPKYDTLLHRKLRERNAGFHKHLAEYVGHKYGENTTKIRDAARSLSKSQAAVQEVSHNMRLLTNDLFHLEDKIDIVLSGGVLPQIKLPCTVGTGTLAAAAPAAVASSS